MNPNFWYESNPTWGRVESLEDLKGHCHRQLEAPNMIESVGDFLKNSRQNGNELDFGTRREHQGQTLRDYLQTEGLLEDFLGMFNFRDTIKEILCKNNEFTMVTIGTTDFIRKNNSILFDIDWGHKTVRFHTNTTKSRLQFPFTPEDFYFKDGVFYFNSETYFV